MWNGSVIKNRIFSLYFSIFETDIYCMDKSLDKLYKNQSSIYKYALYLVSIVFIVFFFPKGGKFKYEFQKGRPWQYENLYSPFDFSIKKSNEDIEKEKLALLNNQIDYYDFDTNWRDWLYDANDLLPSVYNKTNNILAY